MAADAHRLQQVFFNLSLNAFHAMEQGGVLRVEVRRADFSDEFVQVDFQDQGSGIDASALEKIFEPGFTTKAGSPGLGLSVCRKVMEQHGGKISVKSVATRNDLFDFPTFTERISMSHVLVVDDEASMRAALDANFRRSGWQVSTAGGVAEALAKFRSAPCGLVVTDMRMGDGDGLAVMQGVRQIAPETAVILLTAYGSVPEAVSP